jgi:hypothetical protein
MQPKDFTIFGHLYDLLNNEFTSNLDASTHYKGSYLIWNQTGSPGTFNRNGWNFSTGKVGTNDRTHWEK